MFNCQAGFAILATVMVLDKPRILQTALHLLDKAGLESLSMRRLADKLGVRASALYWHFKNKQALLDAMGEAMSIPLTAGDLPDELDWDLWLDKIAKAWRQAMLLHRDGALVLTSVRPQSEHLVFMERLLARLVAAGFTRTDALRGFYAVTNYVLGSALEEQRGPARRPRRKRGRSSKPGQLFGASVAALSDRDATFEHGLGLILAGLRAQLAGRK